MNEPTASPSGPPPEPRTGLAQRFGRAGMSLLVATAGCFAVSVIFLLVFALGYSQTSPGGWFSDIRRGKPVPDFSLPVLDGGGARVSASDYRGRPVAINFWATYCPNCVLELPALRESESVFAEQDFAVIYLNAGQTRDHVRGYLAENALDALGLPVLIDPGKDTYQSWGIVGLPTTIWVDREGRVHDVTIGGLITVETVEEQLRAMGELD